MTNAIANKVLLGWGRAGDGSYRYHPASPASSLPVAPSYRYWADDDDDLDDRPGERKDEEEEPDEDDEEGSGAPTTPPAELPPLTDEEHATLDVASFHRAGYTSIRQVAEWSVPGYSRTTAFNAVQEAAADLRIKPPRVYWFADDARPPALEGFCLQNSGGRIFLRADLTGDDLRETAAHEVRHIAGGDEPTAGAYGRAFVASKKEANAEALVFGYAWLGY